MTDRLEPTVRDWILRGLVASCISSHTLYRWYSETTKRLGYDTVPESVFYDAQFGVYVEKLIYVQRQVTCYEHGAHETEDGWSLTDTGISAASSLTNL